MARLPRCGGRAPRVEARARFLMPKLLERARELGVGTPAPVSTPYINTIPAEQRALVPRRRGDRAPHPGLHPLERRGDGRQGQQARRRHRRPPLHLRLLGRPVRGRLQPLLPGQGRRPRPATPSTSRATPPPASTPGPTSRAASPRTSSTTSAWRSAATACPATPTPGSCRTSGSTRRSRWASGPLNSIYHARFNRYLHNRQIDDTSGSRVWCFIGDGEIDEPETLGSISLAAREGLDNLTWVVNCNLQRLDGPVRGNGKIIQELEAIFRGAGWNVIKVIWGWPLGRAAGPRRRRRAAQQDERRPSTASSSATPSRTGPTSASTSSAPTPACGSWSSTCPTTTSATCPAAATTTASSTPPTRRPPSRPAPRR